MCRELQNPFTEYCVLFLIEYVIHEAFLLETASQLFQYSSVHVQCLLKIICLHCITLIYTCPMAVVEHLDHM